MPKKTKIDIDNAPASVGENLPSGTGKGDNVPMIYIKQPFPVSSMYADLTLQQTHIVVEMMDNLQEKVDKLFKVHKENGQELLLFSEEEFDEDGIANIDVKFSALANRPDSYRDVEKITAGLMSAFIKIEDESPDGEVQLEHFLDSIRYPKKGSRRDVVRFRFTKPQARRIFNYKRYSKYLKHVARHAKSKHTARLYMLITTNRELGKWFVTYKELRRMLGCDIYDEQKKEYVVNRCKLYKHFKSDVLKVAEKELKELAQNNLSDCYFEFEEIFADGVRKGDPEKLQFNIFKSHMGELVDLRAKNNVKYFELQQFMQESFGLTYNDCQPIIQKIDDDMYEQFSVRVHEIDASIRKQGDKIKNKKKYAVKSLNEALNEFVHEQNGAETADISDSKVGNAVGNGDADDKLPKYSESTLSAINGVKQLLKDSGKDAEGFLDGFTLKEETETSVVIEVLSKAFLDTYTALHGDEFYASIEQKLGKEVVSVVKK